MSIISKLATILLLHGAASNAPIARRPFVAAVAPAAAAESRASDRRPRRKSRKKPLEKSKEKRSSRGRRVAGRSDRRVVPWVSVAVLMNVLFFFRSFAAPFFDPLGEPRRATASSVYFSLLAFLYVWLASVTVLTVLPQFSTNYNVVTAAALFFYMAFVSVCALLCGRLVVRGGYYVWLFSRMGRGEGAVSSLCKLVGCGLNRGEGDMPNGEDEALKFSEVVHPRKKRFPVLIAFQRPFRRLFNRAIILSAALCTVYSHCWSRNLLAFDVSSEGSIICRGVFFPTLLFGPSVDAWTGTTNSCHADQSCADERSIWILWAVWIIGYLFYYALHEFTGKHHADYPHSRGALKDSRRVESSKSSSSSDMDLPAHGVGSGEMEATADDDEDDNGLDKHKFCREDAEEEEDDEIDAQKHLSCEENDKEGNVPWQSISARIQKFAKTKPEQPQGTLAMVSWYSNIVFSTGFDMLVSFKIFLGRFDARKMQLALLKEKRREADGIRHEPSEPVYPEGVFDFSHCHRDENNSEGGGFWFDFVSDCGDGFNSSYQVSRMLAQPTLSVAAPSSLKQHGRRVLPRGKLLINGGDLAYPDPTPESYEKRFFRTFEDALPPPPSFRREHISIRKPALPVKGWKIGDDAERRDQSHLSSYQGPCAFLVPGNHDWFDGLSTYTRYILSRDWLGGWLMPQRTSYFALKLPQRWWLLGFDLALDDDINIEQFHFFANLAENSMKPGDAAIVVSHVPHWVLNEYENHSKDSEKESNLTELIRTHLTGKVKLRLAGDLHHYTRHAPSSSTKPSQKVGAVKHTGEKPTLIVAGGGGAFLHPTHCFQDQIKVGEEDYSRVCAYPSTKVSRHLSWLNLWQFRWRNWRLDVLWIITHFGICSSLFPLCGVYDDYLEFNPSHNLGYLLLWVFSRVGFLFAEILVSGRISLLFTLIIIGITYIFTDSSNLKRRTHLGWSLAHAFAHISSALTCMLFLECLVEFVLSEGLVVTQNVDGAANAQSCGTGLATSIYDEYTIHFSHTLEDFELLNSTNNTLFRGPPDLLPSCRFDERLYTMASGTFSWLYHEAPFLKATLAVFDIPGIIGSTHVDMCRVLCLGGAECTYSSDFLRYQQLDRVTIVKYLAAMSLYFVIFAVPVAGNVFGTWLAVTLNYFNCQYDEGFSSLRMEHWKNFLRMHINESGDLEIFAIGLHRVPKKWRKDPSWEGGVIDSGEEPAKPSWMWKTPSKWIPWRKRKKFAPQIIDYSKIKRTS